MPKNLPLSKILLSLAAVSVLAVAAVGGTFANFTATPTAIASNAFASGTLSMTRSGSGAIFNASAMKIGDSATGTVTITNTGTLAGVYSLSGSTTGSAPLASQLNLKIYKDAGCNQLSGVGNVRCRRSSHVLLPRHLPDDRDGRRRQRPPGPVRQHDVHLVSDPGVGRRCDVSSTRRAR